MFKLDIITNFVSSRYSRKISISLHKPISIAISLASPSSVFSVRLWLRPLHLPVKSPQLHHMQDFSVPSTIRSLSYREILSSPIRMAWDTTNRNWRIILCFIESMLWLFWILSWTFPLSSVDKRRRGRSGRFLRVLPRCFISRCLREGDHIRETTGTATDTSISRHQLRYQAASVHCTGCFRV